VLAVVASLAGLLMDDLYHDNTLVKKAWLINDWLTLLVAVPLLVGAMIYAQRGSLRAQLLWVSMLAFMLYNYAFYLFGAAFNAMFLVYTALFSLSIFALVWGLSRLDVESIGQNFDPRTPVRWLGGFMGFIAFFLGFKEIGDSLGFVLSGKLPASVTDFAHPTSVIFALDLSLIVPGMILAAFWLWQRTAWGYVLGNMMMVLTANYGLVLVAGTAYVDSSGLGSCWATFIPAPLSALEGKL
jgi:hypothetical protein